MRMAGHQSKLVSIWTTLSAPFAPPQMCREMKAHWLTRVQTTAVRIRPPLQPTDPGFDLIPQRFQRSMVQVMSNTTLAIDAPQGRKVFVFDRVFSPEYDQAGVWDYLEDCVNAFTTGYNVSLLAYGQSGAGKSYTMGTSGPNEQDDLDVMGKLSCLRLRAYTRARETFVVYSPSFPRSDSGPPRCHPSRRNRALREARWSQRKPEPRFYVATARSGEIFCPDARAQRRQELDPEGDLRRDL